MGGKADDIGTLCTLAKPTGRTGDIVPNRSGAGDDGVVANLKVGALLIRGNHSTHGQVGEVALHHGGMGEPIGGHVDGEAVTVSATDRQQVGSGQRLVGVGEATAPLVRRHQLSDGWQVDPVGFAWQVAHLVMAPQLPLGHFANLSQQGIKIATTLALGYHRPVNSERTTEPVAAAAIVSFEGASGGAGVAAGGRDGQRSHLTVRADSGEVEVSHGVVCVGLAHNRATESHQRASECQ